jgi:hypothetical protein
MLYGSDRCRTMRTNLVQGMFHHMLDVISHAVAGLASSGLENPVVQVGGGTNLGKIGM